MALRQNRVIQVPQSNDHRSETLHCCVNTRRFDKHDVIYGAGDDALHFYQLISGFVSLELYLNDGRRQLAEIIFPGEVFGFASGGIHNDTAVALQPSTVRVMRLVDLQRAEQLHLDVTRRLGRQLEKSHDHVLAMGRKTAEQKVCQLLSQFGDAVGERPNAALGTPSGVIHLQVPLTRGEMGDYLGLSLETVCRTITCLQRKRLIEIGPRQRDVTLLQPGAIRSMAG